MVIFRPVEPEISRGDENASLLTEYARSRDPALRERLIVRYLGLVSRLARRFSARSSEADDLIQVGYIGLINAIDRFDPARGGDFLPFAVPTITGEMSRYLRDKAGLLRPPRPLLRWRAQARAAADRLAQELSRTPTPAEIAAALPQPPPANLPPMDQPLTPLPLDDLPAAEDVELARSEDRTMVRQILARLNPRERIVLYLRFYQGLSQAQAARRLGISQMRVCRWEHRALDKFRSWM